jgi:YHS domain-containing protein
MQGTKEVAMSKYRRMIVLVASLTVGWAATGNAQDCLKTGCPTGQRATHFIDQDAAGVAIKGYDPVAYFTVGHPVKGSPEIEYVWKDARWHFSTQENRDAFSKDPEKFSPQYGGYCSFGVSVNVLADIDPDAWAIIDGKLYLYHRPASLEKFKAATAENMSKANRNWPDLQP